MQLPILKTLELLQTRWKSILDPVLKNPLNDVSILSGVHLIIGENKIPHLLSQKQQGWFLVDVNGVANIYRSKPLENLFLYLTSDAAVTASIGVF